MPQHKASPSRPAPLLLPLAFVLPWTSSACAVSNRLGQEIAIERHSYAFAQQAELEWWAGVPPASVALPVVLFLEGDGGQCQPYYEGLWRRFLTRYTGRFVLVRPRTLVNVTCDTPRWTRLDLLHRVDELEVVVTEVARAYPERPLILLGHSAGAHLARLYAARHPQQIAGLVNLSGGYDQLSEVLRDIAAADREAAPGLTEFIERAAKLPPEEAIWNRTAAFWQQMLFSGVRAQWLAYDKPCLVLHGTEDTSSVPWRGVQEDGEEALKRASSCQLTPLRDVGHNTLNEAAFVYVDRWLAKHWPQPAKTARKPPAKPR